MDIILPVLTSLAVLGVGLLFAYLAARLTYEQVQVWRMAKRSQAWASTQGLIRSSEIVEEGMRSPRSQPRVSYSYQVGGVEYQGSRINFSFAQVYTREEAEAVLAPYPLDAWVGVYYDPGKPGESCLDRGHSGLAVGLLMGLLVFLPACLCLAVGIIGLTGTAGK